MKKLELKHLAPYLPYGLKCEILNYKSDYVGNKYGTISGYYFYDGIPHYYVNKNKNQAGKDASLIKPILRPLSDLTKEIEIDGEKFIPINDLVEKGGLKMGGLSMYGMGVFIKRTPLHVDFWAVNKLLEWHFDIHNLIEKGLAIDINTLEL